MTEELTQAKSWTLFGVALTEREYNFVCRLREGDTPAIAAARAGYAAPATAGPSLVRRPHIRSLLEKIQQEMREQMQVTREAVVARLDEAYHLAKDTEDPATMVRVCAELNRMFGFYAAEKKEITLGADMLADRHQLSRASDEKLLELLSDEDGVWSQLTDG